MPHVSIDYECYGHLKDADIQDDQWCHHGYQAIIDTDLTELHGSHTLLWKCHTLAAAWKRSEDLSRKSDFIGSHSRVWGHS